MFEKASQITAPDSLGAFMRGKQVIVVGDTKQIPPSDLFGKIPVQLNYDDLDRQFGSAEMESILFYDGVKGSASDDVTLALPILALKIHLLPYLKTN